MKKYDVTLTAHYEKTISVYASSLEDARKKVEIVLFDTDLIDFTDEDFTSGEANISEAQQEDEEEISSEDECLTHEDCSDCPYLCPMCGECCLKDED